MPGVAAVQAGPAGVYQYGVRSDIKTLATTSCAWGAVLIAGGPERFMSPAWATARVVPGAPGTVGAVFVIAGLITWGGIAARWNRRIVMTGMTAQAVLSFFLAWSLFVSVRADPTGGSSYAGVVTYLGMCVLCANKWQVGHGLSRALHSLLRSGW